MLTVQNILQNNEFLTNFKYQANKQNGLLNRIVFLPAATKPGARVSTAEFIHSYGYLAIAIGTILEGEVVLTSAAILAGAGYLSFPGVIISALIGSVCGDQIFFFAGKTYGVGLLKRSPSFEKKAIKVFSIFQKNQILVILCFRFVYGFRAVTPIIIGAAGIKPVRFFLLNVFSAFLWSLLVTLAGFHFGWIWGN